ncbi:MAG TPA: metallopeptidase TldD-related protein, partial [Thermoanaerobaculia bacterium]|nr:metallopeptidase TldD-related protein [Thermoanaerobaculia bacterium]
ARLAWARGRLAVVNHLGLRRTVEGTAASFDIQCSRNPGGGRAAAASRSLAGLAVAEVAERARQRQAPQSAGVEGPPEEPVPLVLAPEAAARLVELLNRHALGADSFHDGTSPLRGNIGQAVFHPDVSLRDDGLDPRGLAFPFDLMGTPKGPVDLVAAGVFLTPAVDPLLAARTGLVVTPHQLGPGEAQATNLFLMPGDLPEPELLRAADGGIWVAALDPVECFAVAGLRFRAVARGARRIRGGALDRALPDLVWEDSVLDVLNRVVGIGAEPRPVASGDLFLGATAAPALAVGRVQGLRPLFD